MKINRLVEKARSLTASQAALQPTEELTYMMKALSKQQRFFFAVFLSLLAAFLLISLLISPSHNYFSREEVYELDSVWYTEPGTFSADTLPAVFPCDETGTVIVRTILPESDGRMINSLCFRASQNSVRIWIDGELLLEQGHVRQATPVLGKSPGSSWVLVRLPEDYVGKELRIELSSPYENYQGLLPEIYLGTKAGILYHILYIHGLGLLTAMILLFLGILLLIFYVVFASRQINNRQILLIGIFGILAGTWLFGESHILQFFTGKLIAWFDLTMVALHLLPLPILFIAADLPDFPYRRFCVRAANFLAFYLIVLLLLQTSGVRDLMEMLNLSMCVLLFFCITVPGLIFWDFLYHKNRKIYPMTVAVSALGFFSCIELVYDLIDLKTHVGSFVQIGILAFYVIISITTIRQGLALFEKGLQTAYYRRLSYSDQMTDCQNRRAFTEQENNWVPGNADVLLMIDLNHLKQVNDTLGHQAGDDYIIACAAALHEVFDSKGTCYRLGGDEFLFWGNYLTRQELSALEKQFTELVQTRCSSISPLCSVATGIAVYSPADQSLADIMRRADAEMYESKRKSRQVSG